MQEKALSRKGFSQFERYKERAKFTHEKIIPRIRRVDPYKADVMLTCGAFVYVCDCLECRARHFAGFQNCRSRFCLNCAHKRSLSYTAKILERSKTLIDCGYIAHMVTFTIRDGDDLQERIDKLRSAWRYIQNGKRDSRRLFKERFIAGVRSFEVKIGKGSGKWHPHMHALVFTPPNRFMKDYDWLQPFWKEATGGEGSVEIHRIRKRKGQALGIMKAIIEVVKYVVAPDKETVSVDDARFEEMYLTMKGFRAVNTWGKLRGVDREAEKEADLPFDEKKVADFVCRLCGCTEADFRAVWGAALKDSLLLDML